MDELTTVIVTLKQLYIENRRQLKFYEMLGDHCQHMNLKTIIKTNSDQKLDNIEAIIHMLNGFTKTNYKNLDDSIHVSMEYTNKLNSTNFYSILLIMIEHEQNLINDYLYAISILNDKGTVYKSLLNQLESINKNVYTLQNLMMHKQ
ncbi:hypothetical protein [Aquimarina agarivorans]|uniref:hypothetical protein n=1 Tax=Aquimarina agarivorans TaxID=980584 RepID=UPI000248FD00|nr:hypothetical protein [Aquimarina agarivorans]